MSSSRVVVGSVTLFMLLGLAVATWAEDPGKAATDKATDKVTDKVTDKETDKETDRVRKSRQEWHCLLTPEQYRVARRGGTEQAFTGEFWDSKKDGVYQCVCCGLPLFDSQTKFNSGTGWPSFWMPFDPQNIVQAPERRKTPVPMIEVKCQRCDAHLGHVFADGPRPTGLRYCINSASLKFADREEEGDKDEG